MDVIIIGAGASGLMGGILLAQKGHQVRILEGEDRPGKKLLATGNGRCNYTNIGIDISRFHGENPKFAYSALANFTYEDAKDFFAGLGMETRVLSKGRAYPRSLESRAVLDLLVLNFEALGGKIIYDEKVRSIKKDRDFIIKTEDSSYQSQALVLAAGGTSLKNSGSDGSGYDLAKSLGHRIIPLGPGIVQMELRSGAYKAMSGTRFDGLLSLYDGKKLVHQDQDEILFTDYGISGPAVLQLSRRAVDIIKKGKEASFSIDLFPDYSYDDLVAYLAYSLAMSKLTLGQSLVGKIHTKLIGPILEGFDENKLASNLAYQDIQRLATRLKNWHFDIKGPRSMEGAQVTTGGVDTRQIDPSTMESKLVDRLYFTGEIIDIDGDCGGFNLHWAWASAALMAKSWRE